MDYRQDDTNAIEMVIYHYVCHCMDVSWLLNFCYFRQPEYTADYSPNFDKKYFVDIYAPKAYSVILMLLGMLQHIYF